MPKIVACPKCAKKYKLPDSFSAKRVRCKACGTDFAAQYDLSQLSNTIDSGTDLQPPPRPQRPAQQQAPKRPVRRPATGANPESLAQMGLSQIKRQPDLFSDDQGGGPDPLRNHVVQDPGFGNASTGRTAKRNQGHSGPSGNDPAGGLDDVVSNPFLSDTGAGSVDARRKQALKRKEEDELLAGYKTSSKSLSSARGPSDLSQNGINRTAFFWTHFFFNFVCSIISRVTDAAQNLQLGDGTGESMSLSRDSAMALGIVVLVVIFAILVAFACFYGITTSLRFQNMRFKTRFGKRSPRGLLRRHGSFGLWVCWW